MWEPAAGEWDPPEARQDAGGALAEAVHGVRGQPPSAANHRGSVTGCRVAKTVSPWSRAQDSTRRYLSEGRWCTGLEQGWIRLHSCRSRWALCPSARSRATSVA
jgi:hypothetical protein